MAAIQCREPYPPVNPGRPVLPVVPGRPRDGKQGAVSHPAETLHEEVFPAPPPPVIRRNHVGAVSLLCAVGGTVACNLALAGPLPDEIWLRLLAAGFEAATVGGLADWFAVTALFRHPLGIPIPHTAIIPERRAKII